MIEDVWRDCWLHTLSEFIPNAAARKQISY